MYHFAVFLSFVGLALTAPADVDTAKKEFQEELQKSFQPVVADVRAMLKSAAVGIEDFGKTAVESGRNILQEGKELLAPMEETDRANIRGYFVQRLSEARAQFRNTIKDLIQRSINNSKAVVENQKSAANNFKNGIQNLENKYLTEDGQQLVKNLIG